MAALREQFREAVHMAQGGPQVMRERVSKSVKFAVGNGQFGYALLQAAIQVAHLFLSPLALRQIARDFGEANEFAPGIAHCRNHDIRPELRAIFSYPPSFILGPSSGDRKSVV